MKRCITALPIIFCAGAACALTPNQWQYRQSLVAPASGLVHIQLPAETLNIARPDLSDLRIIDAAEKEVPFLIDQPLPQPESTVRAKDFRAELAPAETRLLITTGTDSTIAGVVLETASGSTFIKGASRGIERSKRLAHADIRCTAFPHGNGRNAFRCHIP
jgi:hypothetical protein